MPKRPKGYHSRRKEKKGGNASKGGERKGPPVGDPSVDDPPVDDPPVDDPPVDDPPVEDPPVADPPVDDPPVDDPPVDGTQADTTRTESSLSTEETLLQSDLGVGENFTVTIPPAEDAIDTDSKTDIDPADADVEEDCISHTEQEAAAGGQMSVNGTRSNEEPGTRPNEEAGRSSTGPGTPAGAAGTSTSSSAEPVDWEEFDNCIDTWFCAKAMYIVIMLLMELLAHSIYTSESPMRELKKCILRWKEHNIKVPYAETLSWSISVDGLINWFRLNRNNHIRCGQAIDKIFVDAFGVAFYNFFAPYEYDALSINLRGLLAEAYGKDGDKTRLHAVPGISEQRIDDMMSFLQENPEARNKFFKGLIVEIIRTAEWRASTLNANTGNWLDDREKGDVRSRYQLVKAMIDIRNVVIHEECKFQNLDKGLNFTSAYQSVTTNAPHLIIHPARTVAIEKERLEKPLKDSKRFKKLREDYEKLMADNKQKDDQLKAKDEKIAQLTDEKERIIAEQKETIADLRRKVEYLQRREDN